MKDEEDQLDANSKEQIRKYMLKVVLPVGIMATILSYLVGVFTTELAVIKSYHEDIPGVYNDAYKNLVESSINFAGLEKELEDIKKEMESIEVRMGLTKVAEKSDSIIKEVADLIMKNEGLVKKITPLILDWKKVPDDIEDFDPKREYKIVVSDYPSGESSVFYATRIWKSQIMVSIANDHYLQLKREEKTRIGRMKDGATNIGGLEQKKVAIYFR